MITLPRSISLFSILTEPVVKSHFERCLLPRLAIGARENAEFPKLAGAVDTIDGSERLQARDLVHVDHSGQNTMPQCPQMRIPPAAWSFCFKYAVARLGRCDFDCGSRASWYG